MAEEIRPPDPIRLIFELNRDKDIQRRQAPQDEIDPRLTLLRHWQTERLKRTYTDMLEDARFASACQFFLTDIYSARDFRQRDHDVEDLHSWLSRFIPAPMLGLINGSMELNELTNTLDQELLSRLETRLDVEGTITEEQYAAAYRRCENYDRRIFQIELLVKLLNQAAEGARFPLVGPTLRMARGPALRAGWSELYDFVTRGYQAFRSMRSPQIFIHTVEKREMRILSAIYDEKSEPFDIFDV